MNTDHTSLTNRIEVLELGSMAYKDAWDLQEQLLQQNLMAKSEQRRMDQAGDSGEYPHTRNYLLFVEHPPVYTLGKSGDVSHVLIGEEERKEKGIEYVETNRGGDITFHGPGQVVGYPIIDLEKLYTDIGRYLRELEEVIILTLAEYGVKGERS